MSVSRTIAFCAVLTAFTVGCSYQRQVRLSAPALPERIYVKSLPHEYRKSSVAVFRFKEPRFASGVGKKAAEALYNELLRKDVFSQVATELDPACSTLTQMMALARAKRYDLIIVGEVLYYFEGSDFAPSRVDEQIRVVHLSTNETLWYAEASDVAPPILPNDYILVINRGTPAPPASLLLQRNAEKFSRLFLPAVALSQDTTAATLK
jgi:hypothetical protein